jgi:hypothetical protein
MTLEEYKLATKPCRETYVYADPEVREVLVME